LPSRSTIQGIVEFAGRLEKLDIGALREGLEIWRLHREVQRAVEHNLSGWGLTVRQIEIMESLYHNGAGVMTPADLADEVGLTRSAMTSTLDSLEKLGHTARSPHPTDRRMLAVSLTPAGRAFIDRRLPERYRNIARLVNVLSKSEQALLQKAYGKVLDLLAGGTPDTPRKPE